MPTPIIVTHYRANGSIDRIAHSTAEAFDNMVKRCGYKAASMFTWSNDAGDMAIVVPSVYAEHMAACNRHIADSMNTPCDTRMKLRAAIQRCRRAMDAAYTAEQQHYARSVLAGIETFWLDLAGVPFDSTEGN